MAQKTKNDEFSQAIADKNQTAAEAQELLDTLMPPDDSGGDEHTDIVMFAGKNSKDANKKSGGSKGGAGKGSAKNSSSAATARPSAGEKKTKDASSTSSVPAKKAKK